MALPVLSNVARRAKYGWTKRAVERQLVNTTLFGVPNVWIHRKALAPFRNWEASVRLYENEIIVVGGKRRPRVTPSRRYHPHRIDSWNYRRIRRANGTYGANLSMHAFGVAVDIDPVRNPQGQTTSNIPKYVTNRAIKRGLTWGGNWRPARKCDPMHVEWKR